MDGSAHTTEISPSVAKPSFQERLLTWTAIGLVGGLAWFYLMSISSNMDGMENSMPGMDMSTLGIRHSWTWLDAWLMFLMWAVMMVAMMLPSASPMIMLYQRIACQRMKQPYLAVALFVIGYLLVWTVFSIMATLAQWVLHEVGLVDDMMVSSSKFLSAVLLITAGVYQLSPWKRTCLQNCQTPFNFIIKHWRIGRGGAFVMGLNHGTYCLGCCWLVMALLFVGGVMNLLWIALLALMVLMEKILPGIWLARVLSVIFLASGIWVLWVNK